MDGSIHLVATSTSDPGELGVNLPAVCDACGAIFPSGFVVSGGGPNYFLDNKAPCPRCPAWGRIPDGVIDLTRPDVAAALRAMTELGSIANLRSLVSLLSAASEHELFAIKRELVAVDLGRSEDQLAKDVQRAAPRLVGAASLIRNRDNRMELAAWLAVLLAIVSIVITIKAASQEVSPSRQDQIVQVIVPSSVLPASPAQPKQHRPGRNECCPCGSGVKFKRCHGSPTIRP